MTGVQTCALPICFPVTIRPQWLFDALDKEFHFTIDAACKEGNCKCPYGKFHEDIFGIGKKFDSLESTWINQKDVGGNDLPSIIWLNPPYSKIKQFMKKAYEESLKGAVVVCLIPCRTDTRYWHDYVMKAHEIRLIKGRLKFGDSKGSAPFPSCIVIFDQSKYDKNNDPIFKTMENKQ